MKLFFSRAVFFDAGIAGNLGNFRIFDFGFRASQTTTWEALGRIQIRSFSFLAMVAARPNNKQHNKTTQQNNTMVEYHTIPTTQQQQQQPNNIIEAPPSTHRTNDRYRRPTLAELRRGLLPNTTIHNNIIGGHHIDLNNN